MEGGRDGGREGGREGREGARERGREQTCQVSRNFRECPETEHDLQVSRKCYKISRN